MELNVTKCFICDVECDADEKFLGTNIARTLTTPMTTVLAKCIRIVVDTENEYFCSECTRKMEEYDQIVQLSLQIETELYELFRKKPTETSSCYLLDAEIISDQIGTTDDGEQQLIETDELKVEDDLIANNESGNDIIESYEMVVEYLDEYEPQSNDIDEVQANETDDSFSSDKVADQLEVEQNDERQQDAEPVAEVVQTERRSTRKRKPGPKCRTEKTKATTQQNEQLVKEETDLDCKQCPFTANTRDEIGEHKATAHPEEKKPRLTCDLCGKTYKSKSALSVHLGTHNGRRLHGKNSVLILFVLN